MLGALVEFNGKYKVWYYMFIFDAGVK